MPLSVAPLTRTTFQNGVFEVNSLHIAEKELEPRESIETLTQSRSGYVAERLFQNQPRQHVL